MGRKSLPLVKDCEGCGVCCTYMGGTPTWLVSRWASDEERARLTPELRAELEATVARWEAEDSWLPDDAPCIWYDAAAKRCGHYDQRPDVCRKFEVGGEGCLRVRRAFGIKTGRVFRLVKGKLVQVRP